MEILKKPIVKDVITNITYLLLVTLYFVCFNTQLLSIDSTLLIRYIHISSMVFLGISIIMFEVGYRKDKAKIFANGIEFLALAIFTLLIKHMPKVLGNAMIDYTQFGIYAFISYYIIKSAIMYTKMRHDQLKELSDIKDIVKEEPTKKVTKRKNIKV